MADVLEPMDAQIHEPKRQICITQDRRSRRGSEHLPAMPSGADPGSAVQAQPYVSLFRGGGLGGVDSDPHPDSSSVRPLVRAQRPLCRHGSTNGILGPMECDEERVALGIDFEPARFGEAGPH